ncbi:MAG TPA: glycosyltransferase family 9 protein [Hymenobacter sp.]|nr:glycosyltransferase family 9 protein [Hymenobacter sp.]
MKTILISRTDAIGDVVLTLPVAGQLKKRFPDCRVVLLGRTYTQPIAASCPWVDDFLNYDDLLQLPTTEQVAFVRAQQAEVIVHVLPNKTIAKLAQLAGIPIRIVTRNRWFHWLTCNRLIALSRRNSLLHEAQLNLALLEPLTPSAGLPLAEIAELGKLRPVDLLPTDYEEILAAKQPGQLNVILHPRSRGSAREWGKKHFGTLARLLSETGHRVFVTGTAAEGEELQAWLAEYGPYLTADLTGRLTLTQLVSFIAAADVLVAGSTGPLHIAASLGRHAIGLYPPIRPMHPGRWAPLGPKAEYIVFNKPNCQDCRQQPITCTCITAIEPVEVMGRILAGSPFAFSN